MAENDWQSLSEARFQKSATILELVESLADESLSLNERRQLRDDYRCRYSITDRTIRNYLARYKRGGSQAFLVTAAHTPSPRIHDSELAEAILALIKERPQRTVPKLRKLLSVDTRFAQEVQKVSDRSIYRFLLEHGLSQKARYALLCQDGRMSYHRFQAARPLDLVQGDARDGIWLDTNVGKKKTYLFLWIDDYSRKILSGRYYFDEKLPRMEDTFKRLVLRWGIPLKVYLDNGSVYIAKQFAWILAQLKVAKLHHKPYQAYCKGKVEAVNKTIKNDFQGEAQRAGFKTLEELNSAFTAWVDLEYNIRIHSQTGESPDKRFTNALHNDIRRVADIAWFEALFLMRVSRTVTKYGKINLESNEYRVSCTPHDYVVEAR
jgi:putative transposase